jgi:hypothetical protein
MDLQPTFLCEFVRVGPLSAALLDHRLSTATGGVERG